MAGKEGRSRRTEVDDGRAMRLSEEGSEILTLLLMLDDVLGDEAAADEKVDTDRVERLESRSESCKPRQSVQSVRSV